MSVEKIVIVKKPTQLEELLKTHATSSQVEFYLSENGMSYEDVQREHKSYQDSLQRVKSKIPQGVSYQVVDKYELPRFEAKRGDLLIPIGDPGLVINCAKSSNSQPVYALNSNPEIYEDVFVTSPIQNFSKGLQRVLEGEFNIVPITMAQATLDDGRTVLGVNDIFVGKINQTSARYILSTRSGIEEQQSSSGVVISTGAGKTGWLKSIQGNIEPDFNWDDSRLIYSVREAFESRTTGVELVKGYIRERIEITSQMPQDGIIFADGMIDSGIEFQAGRKVTIKKSDKTFNLISLD